MSYNLGNVKGPAGKGIQSITKTGTSGLVDTYTITYTDGSTSTFTVTNGTSGADIVTSWESTLSDEKVPSEKLTKNSLDAKSSTTHGHGNIDKDGKIGSTSGKIIVTGTSGVLSASDIKTINNNSLIGSGNIDIQGGGSVDIVTSWSGTLSDSKVPSEKLVKNTIDGLDIPTKTSDLTNDGSDGTDTYVETSDLGAVATSNSYNDLDNKPTIPDVSGKIDTAGTGLTKYGTTLNHSNSIIAVTTAAFKKIKYDAQGHITGTADVSASDLPSHSHDVGAIFGLADIGASGDYNDLDTFPTLKLDNPTILVDHNTTPYVSVISSEDTDEIHGDCFIVFDMNSSVIGADDTDTVKIVIDTYGSVLKDSAGNNVSYGSVKSMGTLVVYVSSSYTYTLVSPNLVVYNGLKNLIGDAINYINQ